MPAEPVGLPKSFMRACLLLLLREQSAHGYELIERLAVFGYERPDPGGLYRALRKLEHEGLVRSGWERSHTGPQRRMYEITRMGMEELHAIATSLALGRHTLHAFLGRYEEFVSLKAARARRLPPVRN